MLSLPTPLAGLFPEHPTRGSALALLRFLEGQGTFRFPQLPTGLFSATSGGDPELAATGYHNVWLRDCMHIAHLHWVIGQPDVALQAVRTVLQFFSKHQYRITLLLEGRSDPQDPMVRPHIRFNGQTLEELPEKWSHAQNDALGACLWLTCRLVQDRLLWPSPAEWSIITGLAALLGKLEFWSDEDSGHWEETRKVEASSIGVATAGLLALRDLYQAGQVPTTPELAGPEVIEGWIARGFAALGSILPHECRQTGAGQRRPHDAALLFLIEPFGLLRNQRALADTIIDGVTQHLLGPYGIRRYEGDSYWCANYKQLVSASERTTDYSDDQAKRDALLTPGGEAQWCLFDPLLSVIYGRWYAQSGRTEDRRHQLEFLRRSLSQLTRPDHPRGGYRCPESYYCENGVYQPNDICPLLWTQAHLRLALHWLTLTSPE